MSSTKHLYSAPKLVDGPGGNWVLYKERMWTLLIGIPGFRRHLMGRVPEPVAPAEGSLEAQDEQKVEEYEVKMDTYVEKQGAIRSLILSSVSESLQSCLLKYRRADELWNALCALHDHQSPLVQSDIFGQLNDVRCPEEGDPLKAIDEIVKLGNDYAAAGGTLGDDQCVAILSRAMPSKYRVVINSLTAAARQAQTPLTASDLIAHLTEAARFDQTQEKRVRGEESAMAARYKDYKSK